MFEKLSRLALWLAFFFARRTKKPSLEEALIQAEQSYEKFLVSNYMLEDFCTESKPEDVKRSHKTLQDCSKFSKQTEFNLSNFRNHIREVINEQNTNT